MDQDLISYESLQIAVEALKVAKWTMYFTALGAIATFAAAIVAVYAAFVAKREISSWKDQEKQLQLVRLKRAIFAYRQKLESFIYDSQDKTKLNERFKDEMQPYLSDIFHELVIAGLDGKGCKQAELFGELFKAHNHHREGEVSWGEVFKKVTELQMSIKVTL